MSLNLFTRSTLAITGALVSLGTLAINPASAARITYDFFMNLYGPDGYDAPLTGRFSYDEATEVNTFYEFGEYGFPQWGVWTYEMKQYEVDFIEFSFLDQVYTQADALSPISFRMDYANDNPIGEVLSWETEDFRFSGGSYRMEAVWTQFQGKTPDIYYSWNVPFSRVKEEPTSAPEPSILGALSVVGLAGLLRKRRGKTQE